MPTKSLNDLTREHARLQERLAEVEAEMRALLAVPPAPPRNSFPEPRSGETPAYLHLSARMAETMDAIRELGGQGVSAPMLAKKLDINQPAAAQRIGALLALKQIVRQGRGLYALPPSPILEAEAPKEPG